MNEGVTEFTALPAAPGAGQCQTVAGCTKMDECKLELREMLKIGCSRGKRNPEALCKLNLTNVCILQLTQVASHEQVLTLK